MSQKINPILFRIKKFRSWASRWSASYGYKGFVHKDLFIRHQLTRLYAREKILLSRTSVKRTPSHIQVRIWTFLNKKKIKKKRKRRRFRKYAFYKHTKRILKTKVKFLFLTLTAYLSIKRLLKTKSFSLEHRILRSKSQSANCIADAVFSRFKKTKRLFSGIMGMLRRFRKRKKRLSKWKRLFGKKRLSAFKVHRRFKRRLKKRLLKNKNKRKRKTLHFFKKIRRFNIIKKLVKNAATKDASSLTNVKRLLSYFKKKLKIKRKNITKKKRKPTRLSAQKITFKKKKIRKNKKARKNTKKLWLARFQARVKISMKRMKRKSSFRCYYFEFLAEVRKKVQRRKAKVKVLSVLKKYGKALLNSRIKKGMVGNRVIKLFKFSMRKAIKVMKRRRQLAQVYKRIYKKNNIVKTTPTSVLDRPYLKSFGIKLTRRKAMLFRKRKYTRQLISTTRKNSGLSKTRFRLRKISIRKARKTLKRFKNLKKRLRKRRRNKMLIKSIKINKIKKQLKLLFMCKYSLVMKKSAKVRNVSLYNTSGAYPVAPLLTAERSSRRRKFYKLCVFNLKYTSKIRNASVTLTMRTFKRGTKRSKLIKMSKRRYRKVYRSMIKRKRKTKRRRRKHIRSKTRRFWKKRKQKRRSAFKNRILSKTWTVKSNILLIRQLVVRIGYMMSIVSLHTASTRGVALKRLRKIRNKKYKVKNAISGLLMACSGRIRNNEATTKWFKDGSVSKGTLTKKIDFAQRTLTTNSGTYGLCIWVCYRRIYK